jgi:hypothetical protein
MLTVVFENFKKSPTLTDAPNDVPVPTIVVLPFVKANDVPAIFADACVLARGTTMKSFFCVDERAPAV